MKKLQAVTKDKKLHLIIEHDENVGFYLIVYPINSNNSLADYLCDSLDEAYMEAKERYGIEKENWKFC